MGTHVFSLATDVPEAFTMKSSVYKTQKKLHQPFTHNKHAKDYKIACADCHHVYKDGKNVYKEGDPVAKCETCHTDPEKPKKPKDGELTKEQKIASHYWAIHENCVGCHKALKTEQKPTGPTSCTECHPKPPK